MDSEEEAAAAAAVIIAIISKRKKNPERDAYIGQQQHPWLSIRSGLGVYNTLFLQELRLEEEFEYKRFLRMVPYYIFSAIKKNLQFFYKINKRLASRKSE